MLWKGIFEMKKPNLCHECKRKRILFGLANARAKGKIIGRKKQRNSDMIRALRKKGLTYRSIADLCGCSHGSVHAEILAMKKEESEKQKILDEENAKKLAKESLQLQANSEPQELSNLQDNKISDAYTYYETVD